MLPISEVTGHHPLRWWPHWCSHLAGATRTDRHPEVRLEKVPDVNRISLEVCEQFFGESLTDEHVSALETAPEEQLVELFSRLNDGWVAWFDRRFDKNLAPDQHYFLGETLNEVEPIPLEKYKQLALYFPSIATPDPLEAPLWSHVQMARLLGEVMTNDLRADMVQGLKRLVQIAPLVNSGAVDLVPAVQVRLSEGVQDIARQWLEGDAPPMEAFALAMGVCSMAAYWPVASNSKLWDLLRSGAQTLSDELGLCNVSVAQAVAEFDVPSVSRLTVAQLIELRANEAAFADFRGAFGVAIREALDQSRVHGVSYGREVLLERLTPHQDRCNRSAKNTGIYDGMLLPAGAAFAVGGLSWLFSTGDDQLTKFENLSKVLINVGAPGAAWLLMGRLQRLISARDPGLAVYSALINRGNVG